MSDNEKSMTIRLLGDDYQFVAPYIAAEIPEAELTDSPDADCTCVLCPMGKGKAECVGERVVIECPWVIGTGMTGAPRELANRVWRGTFFHVGGSDIPVQAIHATDLARAVRLTLGKPGLYRVSDGRNHTLDDLADALAWRLGQKRILTAPSRWARWLPGHAFRSRCAAAVYFDTNDFATHFPEFAPADVAEYLKTHVYDETSL